MSDTSLAQIIQYGTSTDRIAFTPAPASGSQVLYLWYETDNAPDTYAWDGSAWNLIGSGGGGGGLVLLESHTANNTTVDLQFTTGITSTYDTYILEVSRLVPASNNDIYVQGSTDGGSTWLGAGNYNTSFIIFGPSGSPGLTGNTGDSGYHLAGGNSILNGATEGGTSGSVTLYDPLNSSGYKHLQGNFAFWDSSGVLGGVKGGAFIKTATAINAIRLLAASGNLASGTGRLYGLAK